MAGAGRATRTKRWLIWGSFAVVIAAAALLVAALVEARRLDPTIRKRAVAYLQEHFDSDAEVGALHVEVPPLAPLRLLFLAGHGTLVTLTGDHIVLHRRGQPGMPPLFAVQHLTAKLDLGTVLSSPKRVHQVTLEGMEINIAPSSERQAPKPSKATAKVEIEDVLIRNAVLSILPKQADKDPLRFQLSRVHLQSVGRGVPMKYQASLVNAKPPGEIQSSGTFGPWRPGSPGGTPLAGSYVFENANLGVFREIGGTLRSTGSFEGTFRR